MPFRSRSTLEEWLEEFRVLGYPASAGFRVIEQDGGQGENTGLVAVTMDDATTASYIQPVAVGSTEWTVTFEAREDSFSLDSAGVARLSCELTTVAHLCSFLEAKSREATAAHTDEL